MYKLRFKPCKALVDFTLPNQPSLPANTRIRITLEIYDYLDQAFVLMPWSLAIPFWNIQKLFQLIAFVSQGRSFSAQSQSQRERFVLMWCKFGRPFEALIRLYRSLVLLYYFEHPLVFSER
jgi:hypothetical protein